MAGPFFPPEYRWDTCRVLQAFSWSLLHSTISILKEGGQGRAEEHLLLLFADERFLQQLLRFLITRGRERGRKRKEAEGEMLIINTKEKQAGFITQILSTVHRYKDLDTMS